MRALRSLDDPSIFQPRAGLDDALPTNPNARHQVGGGAGLTPDKIEGLAGDVANSVLRLLSLGSGLLRLVGSHFARLGHPEAAVPGGALGELDVAAGEAPLAREHLAALVSAPRDGRRDEDAGPGR